MINEIVSLHKKKKMDSISIIVAIDENNAIGKDNNLLCHLPNDLKYFKELTTNHTIIMGRKTFDSLPNGALPNRRNIVISHNNALALENCELANSIEQAINLCQDEKEVFIIGGSTIYNEAIKLANKLYVTQIHNQFEGADTFFPEIDFTVWKEVFSRKNFKDEKNKYEHDFILYQKI